MALIDIEKQQLVPESLSLRSLDSNEQKDLGNILPLVDGSVVILPSGEQLMVKARLLPRNEISASDYWLTGQADQPAMCFKLWSGEPVVMHPERIAAVASLLTDADGVLGALELKFGTSFEPDQLLDTIPEDSRAIELKMHGPQGLLHNIYFAFPAGFTLPVDPVADNLNLTHVPVVVSLSASVASIDVDDASAMDAGDLLILRAGSWQAVLETPFGTVQGLLDSGANQFSIANGAKMQGQSMTSDEQRDGGEGPAFGSLRVPVSMKLPDQSLTIEELGKLRAGLAVPLGLVTAGVSVELVVAGRTIAKGELVRLGDQFAVHIDEIPQQELPEPPADTDVPIELPDESGGMAESLQREADI